MNNVLSRYIVINFLKIQKNPKINDNNECLILHLPSHHGNVSSLIRRTPWVHLIFLERKSHIREIFDWLGSTLTHDLARNAYEDKKYYPSLFSLFVQGASTQGHNKLEGWNHHRFAATKRWYSLVLGLRGEQ